MIAETIEDVRALYETLKAQHLAFATSVSDQAHSIAARCLAGQTEKAGVDALMLCTEAGNIVQRYAMQQESNGADRYDLAALVVDAETASNSETGWEREELK